MNIAFTTIIIFIVLSPGYLFKTAYSSSKLSVKDSNRNLLNDLTWSILPSLIIHVVTIATVECFTNYRIDFERLGNLMLGTNSDGLAAKSFSDLKEYIYPIFFYNLVVFGVSYLFGYLSMKCVRYFKLDRKIRMLRFSNKWHYILTGECLDFPDVPDHFEDISFKIVNVLCKVNGKSVLYTGEYFNYYIDSKGDLEAIHLKYPVRRYLDDDKAKTYYQIPSRYLVIPSNDIININLKYINSVEIDISELTDEDELIQEEESDQ